MSTRESPRMRAETLALGVSQVSGGSHTEPGGYAALEKNGPSFKENAQFVVSDNRTLDEVIGNVAELGYIPSFCVGCEQKGRMGTDFIPFAQSGQIHNHCTPNAIVTAYDYAVNYASENTKHAIERVVALETHKLPEPRRHDVMQQIVAIGAGAEPRFC